MRIRRDVNNVRFSCAYLFRIKVGDKYLLVKDEQGRGTFQPVGGVYKYLEDNFFAKTHAVQCTRFGTNSDLDCDLRVIVPRKYAQRFNRWYKKEIERETADNLYREFQEEILDRIDILDPADFETIKYRYCGEHIESDRLGESDLQIRIADVVELIPTPAQTKAFMELSEHESNVYCFASKEEIYNLGCSKGHQVPTIATHSRKILIEEEHRLKRNRRSNVYYSCKREVEAPAVQSENWKNIEKAELDKPFTFISYNSSYGKTVWDFCCDNRPPFDNLWIDRKNVAENWLENARNALDSAFCEKAVMFINKEYLIRSTACYQEASMIVQNKIPHIIVLMDVDQKYIRDAIKDWIYCDVADKDKLRVFKKLFHYDDDTGHFNCSLFSLNSKDMERMWQAYSNL